MDTQAIFTNRLREIVEDKGWSRKTLSKRSGIHYQQVTKLMKGERADPRLSTVVKLANALGVTTDYLAGIDYDDK